MKKLWNKVSMWFLNIRIRFILWKLDKMLEKKYQKDLAESQKDYKVL